MWGSGRGAFETMAHVFCLAESIFRSADLIVEYVERNQGTEIQSLDVYVLQWRD